MVASREGIPGMQNDMIKGTLGGACAIMYRVFKKKIQVDRFIRPGSR